MEKKINIRLCLGSSCYSRGNDKVLEKIKNYLRSHNLEDQVDFRGSLCCGKCSHGPNLEIDGQKFKAITEENIESILTLSLKQEDYS